jgi:hypothetical protein
MEVSAMNAKPKNVLIGALATLILGAFGTPFVLSSNASTFSETPSHSERWILQVSDDDSRMDRTERSVTESSTDRPNAMERHEGA